jgi:hypothetical protein
VATVAFGGALLLACWRHSQYLKNPFDDYVFNPQERVTLQAHSPAISLIEKSSAREPDRPSGFSYNLFPGYHQVLGWESVYGVDPLRNRYYETFVRAAGLERVWAWEKTLEPNALAPLLPFYDLLGVRHHLATHLSAPLEIPGLKLEAQLDLDVYSSPTAWPRAFFTDRVDVNRSLTQFLEQVRYGDGRPFATVDPNDGNLDATAGLSHEQSQRTINPATDYRLTTNTTTFSIIANAPGVVVLTEAYYPDDFEVTLDGKAVPYFRVNHAFKGIFVDQPGRHVVSFRYWPARFTFSLWLAALGLALLIGLIVAVGRKHLFRLGQEAFPTASF